ncbi:MAG: hypothetical protein ACYCQI_06115 [Gammaproteobacteria bacterium]
MHKKSPIARILEEERKSTFTKVGSHVTGAGAKVEKKKQKQTFKINLDAIDELTEDAKKSQETPRNVKGLVVPAAKKNLLIESRPPTATTKHKSQKSKDPLRKTYVSEKDDLVLQDYSPPPSPKKGKTG